VSGWCFADRVAGAPGQGLGELVLGRSGVLEAAGLHGQECVGLPVREREQVDAAGDRGRG
jgi:hypothetical protein